MKKIVLLLIFLVIFSILTPAGALADNITYLETSNSEVALSTMKLVNSIIFKQNCEYAYLYGYKIKTGIVPIISKDSLFLPLGYVTNIFGGNTRSSILYTSITAENGNKLLIFPFNGKMYLNDSEVKERSIKVSGSTYIPLEVISQLFNQHLYYHNGIGVLSSNEQLFEGIDYRVILEAISGAFDRNSHKTLEELLSAVLPEIDILLYSDDYGNAELSDIGRMYKRAITYYKWHMYEYSIKQLDLILALDKQQVDAHNLKAVCLELLFRYDEAIESYNNAIYYAPYFPLYYRNKGNLLLAMNRYEEAIDAFEAALDINGNDIVANIGLGNTFYNLGQYKNAIDNYTKAIKLGCEESSVFFNLCSAFMNTGSIEEALLYIDKAILTKPDYMPYYVVKGAILNALERYEEAADILTESLKVLTDNSEVYNELGYSMLFLGRYEEANLYFKNALKLSPYNIEIITNLCDTQILLEQYQEAIETIEYALNNGLADTELLLRRVLILNELDRI